MLGIAKVTMASHMTMAQKRLSVPPLDPYI